VNKREYKYTKKDDLSDHLFIFMIKGFLLCVTLCILCVLCVSFFILISYTENHREDTEEHRVAGD